MLTPEQARIADSAIERVRSSVAAARSAVSGRSAFLTWLTGSASAEAAGAESLRQSEKILGELERRRPALDAPGLVGFVELANAGASVGDILESARLATAAGFGAEVVTPTLRELDPTNLGGPVGKVALAAAVLAVLAVAWRFRR